MVGNLVQVSWPSVFKRLHWRKPWSDFIVSNNRLPVLVTLFRFLDLQSSSTFVIGNLDRTSLSLGLSTFSLNKTWWSATMFRFPCLQVSWPSVFAVILHRILDQASSSSAFFTFLDQAISTLETALSSIHYALGLFPVIFTWAITSFIIRSVVESAVLSSHEIK